MTIESPIWSVAGASWRGTSHQKNASPCQDAFAWDHLDREGVVLAVSDGAGSAPLSELGSKLAVHAAIGAIRAGLAARPFENQAPNEGAWRALLLQAAASARDEVIHTAKRIGRAPRDLASTLIVVIANTVLTVAIQIGDGAAVIETGEGDVRSLTRPDTGEFMGESTFLVSRQAVERAQIVIGPRSQSIALFSDGLQLLALLYPTWEPFAPFFRSTFDFLREQGSTGVSAKIEAFLSSERLLARTDDDVTLLLARSTVVPTPVPSAPPPSDVPTSPVADPQEVIV